METNEKAQIATQNIITKMNKILNNTFEVFGLNTITEYILVKFPINSYELVCEEIKQTITDRLSSSQFNFCSMDHKNRDKLSTNIHQLKSIIKYDSQYNAINFPITLPFQKSDNYNRNFKYRVYIGNLIDVFDTIKIQRRPDEIIIATLYLTKEGAFDGIEIPIKKIDVISSEFKFNDYPINNYFCLLCRCKLFIEFNITFDAYGDKRILRVNTYYFDVKIKHSRNEYDSRGNLIVNHKETLCKHDLYHCEFRDMIDNILGSTQELFK